MAIIAVNAKKTYLPAKLNPKTGKKEGGGPCFLGIECIFDDVHSKLKEFPLVDIDGKKKQPRGHKVWWSPKTGKYSLHNPHVPVLNPETVQKDNAGKPIPGSEDVLWGMNGLPLARESKGHNARKDGTESLPEAKFIASWGWARAAVEAIKACEGYFDVAKKAA